MTMEMLLDIEFYFFMATAWLLFAGVDFYKKFFTFIDFDKEFFIQEDSCCAPQGCDPDRELTDRIKRTIDKLPFAGYFKFTSQAEVRKWSRDFNTPDKQMTHKAYLRDLAQRSMKVFVISLAVYTLAVLLAVFFNQPLEIFKVLVCQFCLGFMISFGYAYWSTKNFISKLEKGEARCEEGHDPYRYLRTCRRYVTGFGLAFLLIIIIL